MSATAPSRRHLLRWIVLASIAVLIALIVALAVYVHTLLQPQRFTALLEGELSAVGLTLDLQAPAEPTLFPHPGVRLKGITLSNTGAGTPLLTASAATIVVPWGALLHGDVAIESVDIESPQVDLGELKALLARLPHHTGPPRLPTIATGIHMSDGTLSAHGTPLLFGFSLDTGSLAPGQPFHLDASARNPSGRQLTLSLTTTPAPSHRGSIDFDPIHFQFKEAQGASLKLTGKGHWRGGENLAMHLTGTLRHAALAPAPATTSSKQPVKSTKTDNTTTTDKVAIGLTPASGQTPMTVTLALDGKDAHVDAHLQPTEFGKWWHRLLTAAPGKAPVPMPFAGKAKVRHLDLGWLKASGLSITAVPDQPASGASTAPTASASAAGAH